MNLPDTRIDLLRQALVCCVAIAALTAAPHSVAFEARSPDARLQQTEFFHEELYISSSNIRIDATGLRARAGDSEVERFVTEHGPDFHFFMDPRSGTLTAIIGSVPLIPGTGVGNSRSHEDVAREIGRPVVTVGAPEVADLVRRFVVRNAALIGVDVRQLGKTRAVRVTENLWQINIPQELDGIPVRHGRIAATISHGNLVLLGTETWGNVVLDTRAIITEKQAVDVGFAWAGGKSPVDEVWKQPALEIVPYAPKEHQTGRAFTGPVGLGYGHRLVWTLGFRRPPGLEAWEVSVDAHTG